MRTIDTIIIGGGQAGLAASRALTERGHDHVVLERGRIAERWQSETWDSLHLVSPNWMNSLPGWDYRGDEPDGFMSAAQLAEHLKAYARSFSAPVEEGVVVHRLRHRYDLFEVVTDSGAWRSRNAVVATGWCDRPFIPSAADALAGDIHQLAPVAYRNPDSVPAGGVLVVGASATGLQLADELRAAGREVTLAVGGHTRVPRHYRGFDIFWWLDRLGLLDTSIDDMPDTDVARREPSLQLIGRSDHRTLDLARLQTAGVRLTGRLTGTSGHRVRLAPDGGGTIAAADARLARLLARIDRYIEGHGLAAEVLPPNPPPAAAIADPVEEIDLRAAGIGTVVWATGYRRAYGWLRLPVLDATGEIRQRRGVTAVPGLYVLGQRFQYRRNSNFIGGVGTDATYVAGRIAGAHVAPAPPPNRTAHANC